MTRVFVRPHLLANGPVQIYGGISARNDFFLHLLDDRVGLDRDTLQPNFNTLLDAVTLTGRLDVRPASMNAGLHVSGSFMLAMFGGEKGVWNRFSGVTAFGSFPYLEVGLDFFNPTGATFTLFARGEWQRDAGIETAPTSATLALFGVRTTSFQTMW